MDMLGLALVFSASIGNSGVVNASRILSKITFFVPILAITKFNLGACYLAPFEQRGTWGPVQAKHGCKWILPASLPTCFASRPPQSSSPAQLPALTVLKVSLSLQYHYSLVFKGKEPGC